MRSRFIFGSVIVAICTFSLIIMLQHVKPVHAQTAKSSQNQPVTSDNNWNKASPRVIQAATLSITSQLNAFKRGDYAAASLYQSAELKQHLGSISVFRRMIASTYPEFADYKTVTFGPIFESNNNIAVQVPTKVVGADGVTEIAVYLLVKEGGIYRVAGVIGGMHELPVQLPSNAAIS